MDNYIRQITITDVKDADTVVFDIDLGFNCTLKNQTGRLYGVNAWETTRRGTWDNDLPKEEVIKKIELGKEATEILKKKIKSAESLYIESKLSPSEVFKKGKYGRWLIILFIKKPGAEAINWNSWLIENGYGYEYMV